MVTKQHDVLAGSGRGRAGPSEERGEAGALDEDSGRRAGAFSGAERQPQAPAGSRVCAELRPPDLSAGKGGGERESAGGARAPFPCSATAAGT